MEHLDTIDKFMGKDYPATELARMDGGLSDEDIQKIEGEDVSVEVTDDSSSIIGVEEDPIHGSVVEEPIVESKRFIKKFENFHYSSR